MAGAGSREPDETRARGAAPRGGPPPRGRDDPGLLRVAAAIVLLPGIVAGLVPTLLVLRDPDAIAAWRSAGLAGGTRLALGVALLGLGLVLVVLTIRTFATVGAGTLAPWDAPRRLVVRGVYRYVRNPMISGVLAILLGEALLSGSRAVLGWFAFFALANVLYIPLSEEPGLVKRFGEEYERYRRHVPRWLPRRRPWDPERPDDDDDATATGGREDGPPPSGGGIPASSPPPSAPGEPPGS